MTAPPGWLAGSVLALGLKALAGADQQPPTFRDFVRTVAVYATVQDRNHRLVPALTVDDFQIFDNGRAVAVTTFSNETVPITVVLLLDMSRSMTTEFDVVRASARAFVDALGPADRVRIGSFGREVSLSPLLTGDRTVLHRILTEELWPGGATPLWRAAILGMESLSSESGRRVLLFVSDGTDSGSDANCAPLVRQPSGKIGPCPVWGDVRRKALSDEFMFYAIGLERQGLDSGLSVLANETGGGYIALGPNDDLAQAFLQIVSELHQQYVLGFTPAKGDGQTHRIEVRMRNPAMTARARKSYVADGAR